MIKQQTKNKQTQHNQHPHPEDDCDGCQNQKKQNNMLVDFYERLAHIETKVDRIKSDITTQQQQTFTHKRKIQRIASILLNKPEKAIQQIKLHNSKEMGYELASALIQREIKAKLENQRLQAVIEQLKNQKKKLQQQKQRNLQAQINKTQVQVLATPQKKNVFYQPSSRYGDSIDKVRRTNSIDSTFFVGKSKQKSMSNSYFGDDENKKYWQTSQSQVQTNFTNFASANKKEKNVNQYAGLNLWLYDFKTEKMDDNPIKSLRKPTKANRKIQNKNTNSKY